jgi:hypothetical protein
MNKIPQRLKTVPFVLSTVEGLLKSFAAARPERFERLERFELTDLEKP